MEASIETHCCWVSLPLIGGHGGRREWQDLCQVQASEALKHGSGPILAGDSCGNVLGFQASSALPLPNPQNAPFQGILMALAEELPAGLLPTYSLASQAPLLLLLIPIQ